MTLRYLYATLMTTFIMRYSKGHFVVTGPDIPPMRFKLATRSQGTARCIMPPLVKIWEYCGE